MAKRVLVIGSGGSGKTTLARRIGERLRLPVIHLDSHYWHSGWVATPPDDWARQVQRFVEEPAWVMDGNYGGTLDIRLAAADTVIFLDVPRVVCLWRIAKRAVRYWGRTRPDLAPGCPETLSWEFIEWVWTYPDRRRPGLLKRLRELDDTRVMILSSRREVDSFLDQLDQHPDEAY